MKHYKRKRLIGMLLTIILVIGIAACNERKNDQVQVETTIKPTSKPTENAPTDATSEVEVKKNEVKYPIEENVTLTLALVDDATVTANAKHLFETPLGKAWQEATGVTIEVTQCADKTALNLLIAGGEYPDLIMNFQPSSYTGGASQAIKDGVICPLNEYIDEYAPDLKSSLLENKDWWLSNMTDEGDIIGAPMLRGDSYLCTSLGMFIRQDWLEELNLEVPQTADEFYNVLKVFKEKKCEVPFTLSSSNRLREALNYGIFSSAFGQVNSHFYQIDGKIHYGSAETQYKDVLTYLHKLYEEGLLDNNFPANDKNIARSNMSNGVSGVMFGGAGADVSNIISAVKDINSDFRLTGIPSLVANKGDKPYSCAMTNPYTGTVLVITGQCKNKEAAAKFINYGYTEEGHMLLNFGIQDESYTLVNGEPVYTDIITKNPNGWTMQAALAQYTLSWNQGPMIQDRRYYEQYAGDPQQQACLEAWIVDSASDYLCPTFQATDEYSKLWSDVYTYVGETFVQFVNGNMPLDDFEKVYLPTLEEMGIERIIQIRQEALDKYYKRAE